MIIEQTLIKGEIEQIAADDELLEYISKHGNDFEKDSQTAKAKFNRLIEEAKSTALKEIERFDNEQSRRKKYSLIYRFLRKFKFSRTQ